ncbi:MAG: acetyl-CoA carboxylase carboxyltransferase subunit alpha [Alphaproteobacteria bacterium]|nr:acetyl-CoA carboxylase carboxyltransferase subunit alpha [Alphaproteobacteria bacterium]
MTAYLDFERPIAELEREIADLEGLRDKGEGSAGLDIDEEIGRLKAKAAALVAATYRDLSPWQKTLVARHPARPRCRDLIANLLSEFVPLAGDRAYGEDPAIVGGLARFRGQSVVLLGHERGSDTASRIKHNFGMAKPEGYRKAQRLMRLADCFGLPLLTLVDTPGAYPGIDAEARGQAEAIARTIALSLELSVPVVACIVGEGGSGGAVALATADRVLMLEHSVYSVISPEGCAAILWRAPERAPDAAEALRLTAQDLLRLGVIDTVVPEPLGGAHRQPAQLYPLLGDALEQAIVALAGQPGHDRGANRRAKFLAMGRALSGE